jgi:cytochrome bd ubiquinol oxidase subunit II
VTAVQYDLPLIWAGFVAFFVIMYVVMDGFDLGIGILFPFARSDTDRDLMMNSVAPIWDGNETWLVLGGTSLLAAFPIAYSVLLPAFYLPLFVMLLALIFRGVSFEFRFKSIENRHWWDRAFTFGSMAATFAQGVVLGSFILGVKVTDRQYSGGAFSWFTPFALFCGLALMAGYAMLGAGWLIGKTTGDLQEWAYHKMRVVGLLVLAAVAIVSLWTPLIHSEVAARWFTWPNILYLSPVPILVLLAGVRLYLALERREHWTPFFLTLTLFLLSYGGLAISLFPYVIPPAITIWDAASPPSSQIFLLVGVAIITPIILTYTFWNYWVFRGKVTPDQHYH